VLAITRLAIVHALFVPPLDANGAVILLNVSFTAHPLPDGYRDDHTTDAHPDHPRHDPIVADHGAGRNNAHQNYWSRATPACGCARRDDSHRDVGRSTVVCRRVPRPPITAGHQPNVSGGSDECLTCQVPLSPTVILPLQPTVKLIGSIAVSDESSAALCDLGQLERPPRLV